jgi:DNA/RNA endonuclease G (NUC1)
MTVIAIKIPNSVEEKSVSWTERRLAVAALEQELGMTFLTAVPQDARDVLRTQFFPSAQLQAL